MKDTKTDNMENKQPSGKLSDSAAYSLNYDSAEDVCKSNPDDCYACDEGDICPNCGCDLWDVFYLFGIYRCDECINLLDY